MMWDMYAINSGSMVGLCEALMLVYIEKHCSQVNILVTGRDQHRLGSAFN